MGLRSFRQPDFATENSPKTKQCDNCGHMKIKDSLALVTGASSGIGAATAIALARKGARVILMARTQSALEAVADKIRARGGVAHVVAGDLTDSATVERLHKQIVNEIGQPEIIINSAGAGRWLFTEETDPAEMVQMMGAPYFAAFYITRLCLPEMLRRRHGHIVNLNSPAVRGAWPGATGYTAARYAMYGFTNALRMDLYGTGINVSSVLPGLTASEYFAHNHDSFERAPKISRLIPTVTPKQVAEAVVSALEHNRREVVLPFMLQVVFAANHWLPWLVEWWVVQTGWKHASNHRS